MFTREDKNSKIKPKQSMHIKSRSNKTNEWPLMSTPINKSMPRKRLLKMRINEKIINYRSRTWKASSQAKALLTSSSVSRSLRKNPLPNISFLPPFPARSRVFFSKSQLALPPHQSTSLAKNPSGKSAPVVLFTTSASVESQPPPWLQSPASPRALCSCSSKKPGPSFKRLSPRVSQVAGRLTMNTYMYIDI